MRTRHSHRIAAAALLAVASGVTLTGSVNAVQAAATRADGMTARTRPAAANPATDRPQRTLATGRNGTRTAKGAAGAHKATGGHDASSRAAGVSYQRIPVAVRPSWLTPAFQRRLLGSGTSGVRLPKGATLPGGVSEDLAAGLALPGIRPGQWLLTLLGSDGSDSLFGWCTANFVFKKGSAWGLGTAGHCGNTGQPVSAYVVPPLTSGKLPGLYVIGKIGVSHNNGIGDDFAMIDISPQFASWMNPTMPVWGGPSGSYRGSQVGLPVKHFGHGLVFGTGGTPRAGVSLRWDIDHGNGFSWASPSSPGDSGSGVMVLTGEAAGDLTHIVLDVQGNVIGIAGTRMPKILRIASGWRLVGGSVIPL